MYTCKLQIKIGDLKFFNFLIFVRNLIRLLFYITVLITIRMKVFKKYIFLTTKTIKNKDTITIIITINFVKHDSKFLLNSHSSNETKYFKSKFENLEKI